MNKFFMFLFLFVSFVIADDFKAPKDKSFVAWKTRKRMFLLKEVKPIGVSTNVNLKKSGYDFSVIIPKNSFDSGDKDRDDEVVVILNGKKHPTIKFSFSLTRTEATNLKLGSFKNISGQLDVNGEIKDVTFSVENIDTGISVKYQGKFSDFGIEPPKVAGGAVAKVYDELELFGTILYSDLML